MQQTSELYKRIVEMTNHWFENTVVVGESGVLINEVGERLVFGDTAIVVSLGGPGSGYNESQIISLESSGKLFDKEPQVGTAVAQEIDLTMVKPAGYFPDMSLVAPYTRAVTLVADFVAEYGYEPDQKNVDGDIVSEWIPQGRFYIDSRENSQNDESIGEDAFQTVVIHGYDAIMKAEADCDDLGLDFSNEQGALDVDYVHAIAGRLGVSVDPRTDEIMTDGYRLPLMTNYSLREVLGIIAAKYLGWFIMSESGELRLVTMLELPEETNYLIDQHGNVLLFGDVRILLFKA